MHACKSYDFLITTFTVLRVVLSQNGAIKFCRDLNLVVRRIRYIRRECVAIILLEFYLAVCFTAPKFAYLIPRQNFPAIRYDDLFHFDDLFQQCLLTTNQQ